MVNPSMLSFYKFFIPKRNSLIFYKKEKKNHAHWHTKEKGNAFKVIKTHYIAVSYANVRKQHFCITGRYYFANEN